MNSDPPQRISYDEIKPRLHTGDLLLFHGDSRRSRIIEVVTRSAFSHIGMIVALEQKPPLLWHTDPRPVSEDLEDHANHGGAQLNDLSEALARMTSPEYGDTPYLRQLLVQHSLSLDEFALQAIAKVDERPFPSLPALVKEWLMGDLHLPTSGRRMFCGEVVAVAYQGMGLLPPDPPANSYSPRDFSAEHENLRLLQGASLGPQMEIV